MKAHFKHKVLNANCKYSIRQKNLNVEDEDTLKTIEKHENISWHNAWQKIALKINCEVRGIGGDSRPRDIGCATTGNIVELQHSRIKSVEFQERNKTVPNVATWIFDATEVPIFVYSKFRIDGLQVYFCCDEFRETYVTDSKKVQVLFHCSDGKLRQACYDSAVKIVLSDSSEFFVRVLHDISQAGVKNLSYFFRDKWPLQDWPAKVNRTIRVVLDPIRVLSEEGREIVDKIHRESFMTIPVDPLTIYNAPPGAGKTTALKSAIRAWTSFPHNKKILVIVFNKSNQLLLQNELAKYKGCCVKTLDALCFQGVPRKFDGDGEARTAEFHVNFNDWKFVKTYVSHCKSTQDILIKMKNGGGAGSANIVQHRLTHPRAKHTICMKHKNLMKRSLEDTKNKDWDASLDTFPIQDIIYNVSTFAARRYVCDRDCHLTKIFQKYDIILVDEMQDLSSSQEMRLIQQAECPIVMVGDYDQTINDFRHIVDHSECNETGPCKMPPECKPVNLPTAIEWYNTYRLDSLTVKWLEDLTGKRMFSHRNKDEICTLKFSNKITHNNTLTICRFNITAIRIAIQFQNKGIRVINGTEMSRNLDSDYKKISPEAKKRFGQKQKNNPRTDCILELQQSGRFENVISMLHKKNISLCDVQSGNFLAVTVVHQIKGFECDHVAVHEEFIHCAEKETENFPQKRCERNCLLVALSRHRKSLVILKDIVLPTIDTEKASPLETIHPRHLDIFKE